MIAKLLDAAVYQQRQQLKLASASTAKTAAKMANVLMVALVALQAASASLPKQRKNFALKGAPKTASAETARPAALAVNALW